MDHLLAKGKNVLIKDRNLDKGEMKRPDNKLNKHPRAVRALSQSVSHMNGEGKGTYECCAA